jgi:large subunit ribosomal protein L32
MPVPKKRRSKARKRTHRSLWKINVPELVACKNCNELAYPHHVCTECGFYDGKQIIAIKVKDKSDSKEA